jgi:uncharacterized protein
MNAIVIDAFEFCRLNERRDGETAVADLPRLAEESVDKFGALHWSLQGGSNSFGHPQMTLSISGSVKLLCQRCLTPFEFSVASDSALVLANDEPGADAIDALLDDDAIDVIVGSRTFNIADLIEDEALLAIPASPKHEVCPDKLLPDTPEGAERAERKVSPFAVLKNLKRH